jgi:spermidine synthase
MSSHKRKTSDSQKGSSKRLPLSLSQPNKSADDPAKRAEGSWKLIVVFFFSGLCGLIYEVVWSRMLNLVFGNTTYAISTVIGVFMFGLALGSFLVGRWLSKLKDLLRGYALIEIGIGIYAVLFVPILSGVQMVHSAIFPSIYESSFLLNLCRIGLSFGLLLIPTLLMGATLPLLGEVITFSPKSVGRDVGVLYAVNTFGAATGCFFSAFVLIPALGLQLTILVGAVVNIIIGLVVWYLPNRISIIDQERKKKKSPSGQAKDSSPHWIITPKQYRMVFFAFMVSGFLALVYEVAWTKALILVFGTSIYAFATILTIYLLGIAFGSLLLGRWMDRIKHPILWFALFQAVIGISVLITTPVIGKLPDIFLTSFSHTDIPWEIILLKEFGICFLIIFLPTFASGASFPLVTRIFTRYREFNVGDSLADVYAFNTIGCILGSLATGFIFISVFGAEKTLLLGGGINLLLSASLIIVASDIRKKVKLVWGIGPVLAAIAGIVLLPSWDPKVMSSGVYMYAKNVVKIVNTADIGSLMSSYKLLFYKEGPSATVAVFERENIRFLRVNGKTDGGNSGDNYTQSLLGLLPVMYSKNPENALVIGLGTGITLGSVLDYPVKREDCIEISPEVVEASHYFDKDNGFVLNSPRTRLHVLDGRTWLMAMPETYDIITSEPSHPWQTGNANLFTVDFFNLAIKRLKKGGVFCQWLPIYQMETEHFRLLVNSFRTVFPHVNIWVINSDALLIGSLDDLSTIDYAEFQRRLAMPAIKQRLAKVEINSADDLLSFFYLDDRGVEQFIAGVQGVNSDNYPALEFSAPKYLFAKVKIDTLLTFLGLSPQSKLPLVNVDNIGRIQENRIKSRAAYFRQWGIPDILIQQMLRQKYSLHQSSIHES